MEKFQRRDLLTLPAQRCTKKAVQNMPFVDAERIQYILTAGRYLLKGREILKATLFNAIDRKPEFLIFCDKKNKAFWTYAVVLREWREAMIHNLPDDRKTPMLAIANDGGTAAAEYFGELNRLASYCILDFEWNVRNMQGHNVPSDAFMRYYDSRQFIDTMMAQATTLPADMDKFIDNHVLPHSRYLYYKRHGKMLTAFCSHCRQTVEMPIPKGAKKGQLNEVIAFCPHCHSKARLKMAGRACEMHDGERAEYVQSVADGFLVRSMVAHRQHYEEYDKHLPREWIGEDFRTFIPFSGRTVKFEYYHHHISGKDEWLFPMYMEPYRGPIYTENLQRIFKGTKFEYSGLYEFAKLCEGNFHADNYLESYREAPVIEQLVKIGMTQLVKSVIREGGDNFYETLVSLPNPSANNPAVALNVTKRELQEMRELNISGAGYLLWMNLKRVGYQVNTEMMKFLWGYGITRFWDLERIAKYGDIFKTIAYMQGQGEKARNLTGWADYIENCKKLGYDITDKRVKYPREFRKMHDRVADEVVNRESKCQIEAFNRLYSEYTEIYGYEDNEYIVRLPERPGDLIREGREMHHCVGTYIDRYADEESIILFIREKSAPDVPFITAEVSPQNRPVQIQDKYDRCPPEAVMRFWKKYQDVVLTAAANKVAKSRKAG